MGRMVFAGFDSSPVLSFELTSQRSLLPARYEEEWFP
jgi:hypothetical protein